MKKIYRLSQKNDVLGYLIIGLEMYKYGMPYRNAAGHIFANDEDLVDLMLVAVERFPELHITTSLKNGRLLNRFETENACAYYLYTGNPDPEIEFTTEIRDEDYSPEVQEAGRKWLEECRTRELTPVQIAAMGFAMNAWMGKGK